ncbi:MAG: pyridoxal-dependent decarboxylase, partial [Melioribacteraceae bacterium]
MGYKVIDLLSDYLEQVQTDMEYPVLPYHHPEDELDFWQHDFTSNSDILSVFKNVLNRSVHVSHPRYMGHQMASPALISTLVAPLIDILNNGSAVYEMGMVGNAIEKVVTDFMKEKIGFGDNASGFLTSGGTLANFTALLAARKTKASNNVWENGYEQKLAIMVSEEAHYSIERAIKILGLGEKGIIKLPVDDNLCIQTKVLDKYLMKAKEDGLHVIAIIGSAATTSTGSYDNFEELRNFATKHN